MANLKTDLLAALSELPEGIQTKLYTQFPAVPGISWPTTVDEAIIAQGQLACNLNQVLQAFAGVTPVDLLLHIGQHNPVAKALLLAVLEYVDPAVATGVFPGGGGGSSGGGGASGDW